MSDHYHDQADLRLLKEMRRLATSDFDAWLSLDNIVKRDGGAIPRKYRELIAVAVACTTQCPYCIEVHSKAAKSTGATREELVRVCGVTRRRCGDPRSHGAQILRSTMIHSTARLFPQAP